MALAFQLERPAIHLPESQKDIPLGAQALLSAYPDHLVAFEAGQIRWKDGSLMTWDDGKHKSFEELEASPDLEDQFHFPYPMGDTLIWQKNFDPGRIRHEGFFKKMYGHNPTAVQAKLQAVEWLPGSGKKVMISQVNQVNKQLAKVASDLLELGKAYFKYLDPAGGTFNWRKIAGTERLSVHSFGAAIDINTSFSDYWRWSAEFKQGKALQYHNRIPYAIVEVFERHGFIWGGKWYHYDTMHFEYRPELIWMAKQKG